jgi:hypothetical protein
MQEESAGAEFKEQQPANGVKRGPSKPKKNFVYRYSVYAYFDTSCTLDIIDIIPRFVRKTYYSLGTPTGTVPVT